MSNDHEIQYEFDTPENSKGTENPAINVKLVVEFRIPMYDRKVVDCATLLGIHGFLNVRSDGLNHMLIEVDMTEGLNVLSIYEDLDNLLMYGKTLDT